MRSLYLIQPSLPLVEWEPALMADGSATLIYRFKTLESWALSNASRKLMCARISAANAEFLQMMNRHHRSQ